MAGTSFPAVVPSRGQLKCGVVSTAILTTIMVMISGSLHAQQRTHHQTRWPQLGPPMRMRAPTKDPLPAYTRMYVSRWGSDVNDGVGWGTAKATIGGAVRAIAVLSPPNGTIYVGCGTFNYSSEITPSTGRVSIIGDCRPRKADDSDTLTKSPVLNFTGTSGVAIALAHMNAIENVYIVGPGKENATIGIDCNGPSTLVRNVNVSGFGTGFGIDSHCYLESVIGSSIHDNGVDIGTIDTPSNAGENISFDHCLISDNAPNMHQSAINISPALAGIDLHFSHCSLDGVGMTLGAGGLYTVADSHIELTNSGTHVPAILMNTGAVRLEITGSFFLQDSSMSATRTFIDNRSGDVSCFINLFGDVFSAAAGVNMEDVIISEAGNNHSVLNIVGLTTNLASVIGGVVGKNWGAINYLDKDYVGRWAVGSGAPITSTGSGGMMASIGPNGVSAGSITLVDGIGSHPFTAAYDSAPVCTAADVSSPAPVAVSSTTTSVSVTGNKSDTVAWICTPATN